MKNKTANWNRLPETHKELNEMIKKAKEDERKMIVEIIKKGFLRKETITFETRSLNNLLERLIK